MDDAWTLLKAYTERQDQAAFAALVEGHVALVYSACHRQLGDAGAAEEVAQSVFILLAQKAKTLRPTGALASWLYQTACLKAKKYRQQELSRRRRETKAYDMNASDSTAEEEVDWDAFAPLLDEAVGTLSESDRSAILQRYFQKQPWHRVGASLGVSEDAARMRVDRSVDRLRAWFQRRGITCSAIALGNAMGMNSVLGVPSTLTATTIQTAIAQTGVGSATAFLALLTSSKGLFVAALLIGTMIPVALPLDWRASPRHTPEPGPANQPVALTLPDAKSSGLIAEWEALMATHGPADGSYAQVYEAVQALSDVNKRRTFRGALIAEWVGRSPQEALKYFREHDSGRVVRCLREWLKVDAAAAISAMRANPSGLSRTIRELLVYVAKVEPDAVIDLAPHYKRTSWVSPVRDAFVTMAREDLDQALALADSLSDKERTEALTGVGKAWAEKNGTEALAWAQGFDEDFEGKSQILSNVLAGWATSDPATALDHLGIAPPGSPDGYFDNDVGSGILRAAADADFDATLDWLADNSEKLGHDSLLGLRDEIAERLRLDPQAMLDRIRDHPSPKELAPALISDFLNEGYAGRQALWDWLGGQEESDFITETRRTMLRTVASREPALAIKWLERAGEGIPERERQLAMGLMFRGDHGLMKMEPLLEEVTPALRQELLTASFVSLYEQEVASLDPWIEQLDQLPPESRGMATQAIAQKWASLDPLQAVAWIETLVDPAVADDAVAGIVSQWAGSDSYECSQWIGQLDPGTRRDRAIRSLVFNLTEITRDPESAWDWAKSIDDPKSRLRSLETAFYGMKQQDEAVANAWLQDPNLTAAEVAKLTKQP